MIAARLSNSAEAVKACIEEYHVLYGAVTWAIDVLKIPPAVTTGWASVVFLPQQGPRRSLTVRQ